ncbi:hypothetical protein [Sinorhizobium medicae]|uniref:hypothetical protein n=1 Tax=Sinorhizobium medicae TaxID=110321 RepID=UPI000FD88C86|nr:hypothetical protein [Sinorhizobium medicae]RVJ85218.1 hypothetical protein CN168_00645 [Sinorhizobium medicae]
MIRFERKPDPQPTLKEVESKRAKQVREAAKEENKQPGAEAAPRASQTVDDDRLI